MYNNLIEVKMEVIKTLMIFLIFLIFFWGCTSEKLNNDRNEISNDVNIADNHNAQNSLDWFGTYKGKLPCADCEGIETIIELLENAKWTKTVHYLGKNNDNTFFSEGVFEWNESGNTITLLNEPKPNQYFVGENYLIHLDVNGNKITGKLESKYLLKKVDT